MAALIALALALGTPDPVAAWAPAITRASVRCGVPAAWIVRVMRAESGGRTHLGGRPIRSAKGAIGLMQLMPGTWQEMRAALGLGPDPDAPADNIVAGACYLRRMYDRFGHPGLFAAYNAGPNRYAAVRAGRRALPAETAAYLASLGVGAPMGSPAGMPVPAAGPVPMPPPVDPLFAIRKDRP